MDAHTQFDMSFQFDVIFPEVCICIITMKTSHI